MTSSLTGDGVTVTATEIAVLSLLRESDWVIKGRQRLQKLAFLLDEQLGDDASLYTWRKYDYGPYASSLNDDMAALDSKGLARILTKPTFGGGTRYTYRLTERGDTALTALREEEDPVDRLATEVREIVVEHGDTPVSNLIRQVRDDYPKYWENSVYRR